MRLKIVQIHLQRSNSKKDRKVIEYPEIEKAEEQRTGN
jgi:hypothetical protein